MTDLSPLEALAAELGAVAARIERETKRELALGLAEMRRQTAELELRLVTTERALADTVRELLATVRNGQDGTSVTLDDVRPLVLGEVSRQFDLITPPSNAEEVEKAIAAEIAAEIERRLGDVAIRAAEMVPPVILPELPNIADLITGEIERRAEGIAERAATLVPDVNTLVEHSVAAAFATLLVPRDGRDADPETTANLVRSEVAKVAANLHADLAAATDNLEAAMALVPETKVHEIVAERVGDLRREIEDDRVSRITINDVRTVVSNDLIAAVPEVIERIVTEKVVALPPAEPGHTPTEEELAPLIKRAVLSAVEALPPPKDGEPGPPGPPGQPGKLPVARAWTDGVHYEGDVRTHAGATWQAVKDTGREPPHEDWVCLAHAGRDGADGRSFVVRDTYSADYVYSALDVVALNGAGFVARRDDPGPCPGDGWQLISMQGRPGKPGERGPQGLRGDRGLPGPGVVSLEVEDEATLVLRNADGSEVKRDLYPLLSRL